jgi:hypothetical protein
MGLPNDHPLKEGELISLEELEAEVQKRLLLKKQLDSIARQAAGLRVVHGIKGEHLKASTPDSTPAPVAQAMQQTAPANSASSVSALAAQVGEPAAARGDS